MSSWFVYLNITSLKQIFNWLQLTLLLRRTSGGNRSGLSSPYENPPAPSPHQQPGTKTTSAPTSPLKVLKKIMLSIQSSFFVTFWLQMNLLKIIFALLPFLTVDLQERPESKKASFLGKVSSLSQVRCHIWIKTVLNLKLGGECQSKWGQRQGGGVQSSKSSEARPVLHLTCHWRPEHRLVKG